jgi:hypothetical protein
MAIKTFLAANDGQAIRFIDLESDSTVLTVPSRLDAEINQYEIGGPVYITNRSNDIIKFNTNWTISNSYGWLENSPIQTKFNKTGDNYIIIYNMISSKYELHKRVIASQNTKYVPVLTAWELQNEAETSDLNVYDFTFFTKNNVEYIIASSDEQLLFKPVVGGIWKFINLPNNSSMCSPSGNFKNLFSNDTHVFYLNKNTAAPALNSIAISDILVDAQPTYGEISTITVTNLPYGATHDLGATTWLTSGLKEVNGNVNIFLYESVSSELKFLTIKLSTGEIFESNPIIQTDLSFEGRLFQLNSGAQTSWLRLDSGNYIVRAYEFISENSSSQPSRPTPQIPIYLENVARVCLLEITPTFTIVKIVQEYQSAYSQGSDITTGLSLVNIQTFPITGKVTLDSVDVAGAVISVIGEDGKAVFSTTTNVTGDYELLCFSSTAKQILCYTSDGKSQIHTSVTPIGGGGGGGDTGFSLDYAFGSGPDTFTLNFTF